MIDCQTSIVDFFLVPKHDGNRLVINLSCLNQYLEVERFKGETPASVMAAMRRNDWATSIDLKDAYFIFQWP